MPPFLRGQQVAREEPTGCSRRQTADEDVATATMCTGIFEIIAPQSNTSRYVLQPLFNVERDDEHSGQSVCNELALPQVSVDCPCLPALSAFSAPFLISSRSPSPSCSRPTTDVDLPRADSTLLPRVGQESFLDARNQVSSLHSRFAGRFVPHFDSYLWFLCSSAFLASLSACPAECNEIRILETIFPSVSGSLSGTRPFRRLLLSERFCAAANGPAGDAGTVIVVIMDSEGFVPASWTSSFAGRRGGYWCMDLDGRGTGATSTCDRRRGAGGKEGAGVSPPRKGDTLTLPAQT